MTTADDGEATRPLCCECWKRIEEEDGGANPMALWRGGVSPSLLHEEKKRGCWPFRPLTFVVLRNSGAPWCGGEQRINPTVPSDLFCEGEKPVVSR